MLFWGTILSSTLRAGPSTSEVKRHKVLSTSKSLALFCNGLVILLANEASEAIRREYRVPGGARASLQRAWTTCAGGCRSLKSSHRWRRRAPVAGDAHTASHISRVAAARRDYARGCSLKSSRAPPTTTRCRRRSCGVAHSFSDVRQTASVSTTEAAAYISADAAGAPHT